MLIIKDSVESQILLYHNSLVYIKYNLKQSSHTHS